MGLRRALRGEGGVSFDDAPPMDDAPPPEPPEAQGRAVSWSQPEDVTMVLPVNYEAEQALLASIFKSNSVYDRVAEIVASEHFADPVHGRIYDACARLIERGKTADSVTLKHVFEGDEGLQDAGGTRYLAELESAFVTTANAEHYAAAVRDLHLRRRLIEIGQDAIHAAYDTSESDSDVPALVEQAEQALYGLAVAPERGGAVSVGQGADKWLSQVEAASKARAEGRTVGITTGLVDLDRTLAGLHPGSLYVIAGRPGMGKTALATGMGQAAAARYAETQASEGAQCHIWSGEMGAEQLVGRMLAADTGIPYDEQLRGVTAQEVDRLVEARYRLDGLPVWIDDTPGLTTAALRGRARRLQRRHGLGLLVVDYLQLLRASKSAQKKASSVAEVSEITSDLKQIARELGIPVIALSQLSRAVEQRENKRPQLSDLRESGAIEQDADVVMFTYREEYYLAKSEPARRADESDEAFDKRHSAWLDHCTRVSGKGEIIVAKNRHGQTGTVHVAWDGPRTTYSNLEYRY